MRRSAKVARPLAFVATVVVPVMAAERPAAGFSDSVTATPGLRHIVSDTVGELHRDRRRDDGSGHRTGRLLHESQMAGRARRRWSG